VQQDMSQFTHLHGTVELLNFTLDTGLSFELNHNASRV